MYSKTIMMGRMVGDPELRVTSGDVKVSTFRVAVDRPYKVDGETKADFFNVVAWRASAEFVCKYFKKGKPILLEGHFETRTYDTNDGVKKYITELIAERISFAGDSGGGNTEVPPPSPPPASAPKSSKAETPPIYAGRDDFTDVSGGDLPF